MAQNRSEHTYTKINTIFKRDDKNCIMPFDGYVMPELEWLKNCKFDAEEKVDGTNVRIEVTRHDLYGTTEIDDMSYRIGYHWEVAYKGKTDNATLPPKLENYLKETFPSIKVLNALGIKEIMKYYNNDYTNNEEGITLFKDKKWWDDENNKVDESKIPSIFVIYGEGYGAGIQSGGYYRKDNAFIGFDVKVDNMYLLKANRDDILTKLGADIVPYIGQFTIEEAIEYVKKGFNSNIAEDEHLAEGLVLRSPLGLLDRRGNRIIFKVKTCDWAKYFNTYHTYDKVEQHINTKANYE